MSAGRWERVWAASGALTVVLFLGGLLFGDVLASGQYPALDAGAAEVRRYLVDNEGDVGALAFFHALAGTALIAFSAYAGRLLMSAGAVTTFLGPANNRSATYGVLLLAALLGFAWLFLASVWLTMRPARRA